MAFLKCRLHLLAFWLFIALLPQFSYAAGLELQEQEIKAGLLYNFIKYTDWPAEKMSGQAITVCIFGSDPFDGRLKPMDGRTVNQHEISLRAIHSIADSKDCHLIYVNGDEKNSWPKLQEFLAGKPVLTISDFDGFAQSGGMIEFGHKDNHINAELNKEALSGASLHVQDRLLKLVTIYSGGR